MPERIAPRQNVHDQLTLSMSDDSDRDSNSGGGDSGDHDNKFELFLALVEKFGIDLDDPIDSVDEFTELEELDLSDKDLEELPDEVLLALPPNLKTLALEKNHLVRLPDSIGEFQQISELYLRENELTELPRGIGDLVQLESLYLEDNKLTASGIPESISNLSSSLVGLCLHRNAFKVGGHCPASPSALFARSQPAHVSRPCP